MAVLDSAFSISTAALVVDVVVVVAIVVVVVLVVVDVEAVVVDVVVMHSGLIKSPRSLLQLINTEDPSLYEITCTALRLNWLFWTVICFVFSSFIDIG